MEMELEIGHLIGASFNSGDERTELEGDVSA